MGIDHVAGVDFPSSQFDTVFDQQRVNRSLVDCRKRQNRAYVMRTGLNSVVNLPKNTSLAPVLTESHSTAALANESCPEHSLESVDGRRSLTPDGYNGFISGGLCLSPASGGCMSRASSPIEHVQLGNTTPRDNALASTTMSVHAP